MLTPQIASAVFSSLISGISTEMDAGFLASLYKCFADSLRTVGSLDPELVTTFLKATESQLHSLAQKRKIRSDHVADGRDWEEEKEDVLLMEEMEGFALEEMQKALEVLDPNHPLLIAVGSVKGMRVGASYEDSDDADA